MMQIHVLLQRLLDLAVKGRLVPWAKNFFTDRPQRVFVKGALSDEVVLNTGAPQGCFLFSVCTNKTTLQDSNFKLFKSADDMALVGLFHKNDVVSDYFAQVSKLEHWCKPSFLISAENTQEPGRPTPITL